MTSVPWIRLYSTFPRHRKTMALRRLLGTVEPILVLWIWAAENAPGGDLTGIDDADIEQAADWRGEPGACVLALVRAGFVQGESGARKLHGYDERTGAGVASLTATREATRERVTRYREKACNPLHNPLRNGDGNASVTPLEERRGEKRKEEERREEERIPDLETTLSVQGPDVDGSDPVRAVFAHYRTHKPRSFPKPVSSSKEWRLIKARLAEGRTVADLCEAIDGYFVSPFHCGENERGREYQAMSLIMRDADHVQQGLDAKAKGAVRPMTEREQRGTRAAETWIAMHEEADRGSR